MKLTGQEAGHWHDKNGRHRMTDPRTISGLPQQFWSADERAYVAHLMEHEGAIVEPATDDPDEVRSLFALIESREAEIRTMRQLIATLRMRGLQEASNQDPNA